MFNGYGAPQMTVVEGMMLGVKKHITVIFQKLQNIWVLLIMLEKESI